LTDGEDERGRKVNSSREGSGRSHLFIAFLLLLQRGAVE